MQTIGSSRLIIELFVSGMSIDDICIHLSIPRAAIEVILRSPLAQNEIARLQHAA